MSRIELPTQYRCDRCGVDFTQGGGAGKFAYSVLRFDVSMRAYDGAWGGGCRNYDLCGGCTVALQEFLKSG